MNALTCHHGYQWDRHLTSALCAIIIALGGCSTTPDNRLVNASAPGVQERVAAPTERPALPAGLDVGDSVQHSRQDGARIGAY
jgi:hypothetical protein